MGYKRFATPRAYIDHINFNLATGWSELSNLDIKDDAGSDVAFSAGNKEDLFDLKPHNGVSIAATTQEFYIQFNTEFSSNSLGENSFLAILNHNFHTADAVLKVELCDSSSFSGGTVTSLSTTGNHTKVMNAEENDTAGEIDPGANGWTLITFPAVSGVDNQYLRITITDENGSAQNFDARVDIGSILYGTYIDFPFAPDLNVVTGFEYDGVKLHESAGGSTFSSATQLGAPSWSATNPWVNTTGSTVNTYSFQKRYGRMFHNMKFSYLADSDLFSADQTDHPDFFTGPDIHSQFFNKIIGQHIPFLFTIDGTSTTSGDYGIFRLSDNELQARQTAYRTWDMNLNLIESW
jgi:hypothetical protein